MSLIAALSLALAPAPTLADVRARPAEDEVVYFLLPDRFENGDPSNDRGGLKGDRLKTGYDPTHKGFYHGGDLNGLIKRLDYIKGLGATAIWLAPIFKNKPVQGGPGQESAGYHGYWVTDFTTVDPHFGTDADFRAFVDAAHAKGMKVYMDIIANHTADVIQFAECRDRACDYRSRAAYPYQRKGGLNGAPINPGFAGDAARTAENFAKLTDPNYAYTVVIPPAEARVKKPDWLNDPIHYHNRGNTTFTNESSRMGDFVGLDDLMTESPRVVAGLIDIYGSWIDRFGIDGFRIDTAKHVNPEFWQAFVPAMRARAKAKGIPNFHIFGEIAQDGVEPGSLAAHTRVDKLPSVLDFAFTGAVTQVLAGTKGTDVFERLLDGDALYEGGTEAALELPTFLGNHDQGRVAMRVRKAFPQASDEEVLDRVILAHAIMFAFRGPPVVYAGDEQGFVGDGIDQDARETQFGAKVASYLDNRLLGTTATHATPRFDTAHPLYRTIAELARVRAAEPALRRGRSILRARGDKPGLLAVSRVLEGREVLTLFNTSTSPVSANVEVDVASTDFTALAGQCSPRASAPGSVSVALPPLGYAICAGTAAK